MSRYSMMVQWSEEDRLFLVTIPEFEGRVVMPCTHEKTREEAIHNGEGVGRQYIGEIGKTDNGLVVVTTHLYDGKKSLPLDLEIYQHASSLAEGKKDREFKKKPQLCG